MRQMLIGALVCWLASHVARSQAIFLIDDATTGGFEVSAGAVDRIRIYDQALTAPQVFDLFNGVDPVVNGFPVTHIYELDGNLTDSLGNPDLVAIGGTLGATEFSFAAGEGLRLETGSFDPENYSVEIVFQFADTTGYRKVLDFENLTADTGLYVFSNTLSFFFTGFGVNPVVFPDTRVHVVLTREAISELTVGYADGQEQFSFIDTDGFAVFGGPPVGTDLQLSKIDSIDPAVAGDLLTYGLTVNNNSPEAAQDVVVTDVLPAGVAIVSTSGCLEDPLGAPTCTLGTIPGFGSAQYTLTVAVDSSSVGVLVNSASVASSTPEIAPGDETALEMTALIRQADLRVTIADVPDPAPSGENVTYTVTIANNGPSDASEVAAAVNLPPGVRFVSAGPVACPLVNNVLNCSAGALTAGTSTVLTVVLEVGPDAPDQLVLTAQASGAEPDPAPDNNNAQETTGVDSSIDLSLQLSSLPEPSLLGSPLTALAEVTNPSLARATQVQVRFLLPATFEVESTSVSPRGGCSQVQNRLTCGVQNIQPDQTARVEVRLNPSEVGSFRISADVTARNFELNPSDNNALLVVTVDPVADLMLDKIAAFDVAPAGGQLDYTLTLLNNGPSPSGDLTVKDTLPEGTTFVISEPADVCEPLEGGEGEGNAAQVTCLPGSLDPSETVVIQLTVELDADLSGLFVNRAAVAPGVFDPNPDNNEAEAAAEAAPRGDLNRDGMVDVEDIGLLIREINDGDGEDVADAGGGSTAGDALFDVNGDGLINRLDLQALARIILRKEEE